jgi:predicted permease
LAFVGLPVLYYSAADPDSVESVAVIVLGGAVLIYNTAAVTVLLAGQHKLSTSAFVKILRQLATNPLILAGMAGAAFALTKLKLPVGADRTLEALGQMALPLALLGVGASLQLETIRGSDSLLVGLTSAVKVILCPLCGYLLSRALGLSLLETRVVCVYMACPTAAASFVLADQMGGDRRLAAGCVAFSTALSLPSLWIVLLLL